MLLFFKKASFLFIFVVSNKFYIKYECEKCLSSIRHWDLNSQPSDCESPPLTTRPGLPPHPLLIPHTPHPSISSSVHRDQRDQMVRLFFNILPFAIIKIRNKLSNICQRRVELLPKWRKFAKSGQTDRDHNLKFYTI